MRLSRRGLLILALGVGVLLAGLALLIGIKPPGGRGAALRVALAPYQDMALLVNYEPLGLNKKYGVDIELVTVAWQDLIPSVASAGKTVDVSFGGLIEYINKVQTINAGSADPVLFVFPLYAFKGGALVAFKADVPDLSGEAIDRTSVDALFGYRMGFPRYSVIHMLVADIARQVGKPAEKIKFVDVPFDDALLAAQSGSLDVVGVGLTQRAEALKQGGRVVLSMDSVRFADIGGFLVRQSTLDARRADVEKLIRIWFECVAFVMQDIESNSTYTLNFLNNKAATNFTVESFKQALANEHFPRSVDEAREDFMAADGKFAVYRIFESISGFLVSERLLDEQPPPLHIIELGPMAAE